MARGEFNGAVPAPSVEHGYHFHFGNVEKRVNSTKAFDYTKLPDEERCDFKQTTSMERPVIYVTLNSINISPQWNYCQCEETASFYWIRDISIGIRGRGTANIWQFTLELDPLATYRDTILKTDAFIEYGFNQDSSGATFRLQDTRQNVSNHPTQSSLTAELFGGSRVIDRLNGMFLLSAVGKSGLNTYALTPIQMGTLLTALSVTWGTLTKPMVTWELALPEFMNNMLFGSSAVECIRSCVWVPFHSGIFTGDSANITLGQYDTLVPATVIRTGISGVKHYESTLSIPWPADDWKRMNCQIQLYVPFFGTLGFPVDQLNGESTITIESSVSLLDGNVSIQVRAGTYVIYTGSTNVAVSYGIGVSNVNGAAVMNAISNTVGRTLEFGGKLAISAATGNFGAAIGSAIGTAGGAVSDAVQAIQPLNMSVGTLAGASACFLPMDCTLTLFYYQPIDDAGFQKVYGYPVMRVAKPVQGYCKTRGFSCAPLNAKPDEISYINAAMDSGVFIE